MLLGLPELDTLHTVGRSAQFIAVAWDAESQRIEGARPQWTSSDPMVATVDGAGRVTATGAGTARIIARVGEAADTATLVVAQVIRFIVVTPGSDTLTAIADTGRLIALAFDSLNYPIPNPIVGWTTSDVAVATVDQAGLVQAAKNGVVLVTASAAGQSASATVLVRQEAVAARIAEDNVTLTGAGATARLSATGLDRNGFAVEGAALTWHSRNPFVATVDASGLVTAWGDGSAAVTATPVSGGQSDTATVTVTSAPQPALIAFQSAEGIEVMSADGLGRRVLIPGAVEEPAWSPDGAMLAFTRRLDHPRCAIYTALADGSDIRRIFDEDTDCDPHPAWSPDGTKIAFGWGDPICPDCGGAIYVVNADGSNPTWLRGGVWQTHPTWSPDGTKLAFESEWGSQYYGVFVMNADGTGAVNLTECCWGSFAPAWSPDGFELAFVRDDDLWLMDPDGSSARSVTASSGSFNSKPAWSPDGAQLVFTNGGDLHVINRDGTGLRRLTSTPQQETNPTWRSAVPSAVPQPARGARSPR